MERLQRKYAIIYVDREGETLKSTDNETEAKNRIDNFCTYDMVNDYYTQSGFLQWNFYLIIPASLVPDKKKKKEIEINDRYTRKFVVLDTAIESFIDEYFPILEGKDRHQVKLVKGINYIDAVSQAINTHRNEVVNLIQGWHRDESLMYSLTQMDKLRAQLINNPNKKVIFYTHISNEYSLAEKKFKLFITKRFK